MRFRHNFSNTATRLINSAGEDAVFKRVTEDVYDPVTHEIASTSESFPIQAFRAKPSYSETNTPELVGTAMSAIYIASSSLAFVPVEGDLVMFNDETYLVKRIQGINYYAGSAAYRLLGVSQGKAPGECLEAISEDANSYDLFPIGGIQIVNENTNFVEYSYNTLVVTETPEYYEYTC